MNRLLMIVILVVLLLPLGARTLNEGVNFVMNQGKFMEHDGETVFMFNSYWEDVYPDKNGAYQFVAQTALVFLNVIQEWDTLSNSSLANQIKGVDRVACPWGEEYQNYVLSITMDEICDEYDQSDLEEMGEMEMFADVKSYIQYYGDISPLSMY